eukprot:gene8039-10235_t
MAFGGWIGGGVYYGVVTVDVGKALDISKMESFSPAICAQAEACLQAIHDCGVLHGDIALRNITYNRRDDRVFIVDFGMSRECSDPSLFLEEMNVLRKVLEHRKE